MPSPACYNEYYVPMGLSIIYSLPPLLLHNQDGLYVAKFSVYDKGLDLAHYRWYGHFISIIEVYPRSHIIILKGWLHMVDKDLAIEELKTHRRNYLYTNQNYIVEW